MSTRQAFRRTGLIAENVAGRREKGYSLKSQVPCLKKSDLRAMVCQRRSNIRIAVSPKAKNQPVGWFFWNKWFRTRNHIHD